MMRNRGCHDTVLSCVVRDVGEAGCCGLLGVMQYYMEAHHGEGQQEKGGRLDALLSNV
jgi:hypothetical protein